MLVKIACGVVGCDVLWCSRTSCTLRSSTPCRLATDDFSGAFSEIDSYAAFAAGGAFARRIRYNFLGYARKLYLKMEIACGGAHCGLEGVETKLRQRDSAGETSLQTPRTKRPSNLCPRSLSRSEKSSVSKILKRLERAAFVLSVVVSARRV